MNAKATIWLLLFVGSVLGSWLASLAGFGLFSVWSLVISSAGALLGVWIGYRLTKL